MNQPGDTVVFHSGFYFLHSGRGAHRMEDLSPKLWSSLKRPVLSIQYLHWRAENKKYPWHSQFRLTLSARFSHLGWFNSAFFFFWTWPKISNSIRNVFLLKFCGKAANVKDIQSKSSKLTFLLPFFCVICTAINLQGPAASDKHALSLPYPTTKN